MTRVFTAAPLDLETCLASRPAPPEQRRETGRIGGGFLVSSRSAAQERRNIRTASTRRDSLPVDGNPSLVKMLETYFSTARSVITSASAMPWLDLPVAMSSST